MKLLLDEHFPPALARALREAGHDVIGVSERAELRGAPDPELFDYARTEGRIIVTENVVDFRWLLNEALRAGGLHPGCVFTSDRRFPRGNPRTLGRLARALGAWMGAAPADCVEHWLDDGIP